MTATGREGFMLREQSPVSSSLCVYLLTVEETKYAMDYSDQHFENQCTPKAYVPLLSFPRVCTKSNI